MSTMKFGWGSRIALLYGGFVVLIAALVTGSMRQDFDLVADDYYQQEIAYQNVLDAGKNQSALSAPVRVYAN
ncbi:MAG: FixH family protein [Taibaiella sp.]|nr:FixH family protein [Taibaiella sp.]